MLLRITLTLLSLLVFALPSQAEVTRKNGMTIIDAWAPATEQGALVASVFMELRAATPGDRLLEAFSDLSDAVEIHGYVREAGVLKRIRLEYLAINPGQTLRLVSGGYHLALVGLKEPLLPCTRFPMTAKFAEIGEVEFPVQVVGPGCERAAGEGGAEIIPLAEPRPGGGPLYGGGPRFWPIPVWPPHGSH